MIALSNTDAQKILTWIDSRSLHFGQSAFLSLESLLDQKGVSYAREDIAEKAILIDILTGVISPLDDGDLVISVFALNKVAQSYGLNLSGAKLTWEDLKEIYKSSPSARIVAHINANHFVIITGITDNSITYIDPGIGADKQNESVTVKKEGFLKAWKGDVTLETQKLQMIADYQSKVMSTQKAQQVRGAFWGSVLSLVGWVLTFTPLAFLNPFFQLMSVAVSSIEGDFISAISGIVTLGFANFGGLGTFFQNTFKGITGALGGLGHLLGAVSGFVGNIYGGVVGFLDKAINFLPGIGSALQGAAFKAGAATLGQQIVSQALHMGISVGLSKGLTSLGVSPEISGFAGQLASGALIGALKPQTMAGGHVAVTQSQNIQASVQQTITLNQIGRLGLELGIDPKLTNIIGLSLGAIQGQIITNPGQDALTYAFSNVKPGLFSSLAGYGVDKLGASLGIPSVVTQAAFSPVLAGVTQGFNEGSLFGKNIVKSINEGLVNGAIAYGVDFASKNITNNALLQALSTRVISGAIEGTLLQKDIFKGVYSAVKQSVLGIFSMGQTNPLSSAIMLSSVIAQKGTRQGLEIYLTNIFNRQSVESIQRSGGLVSIISAPKEAVTLPDGTQANLARISSGEGILLDAQGNLLGFEREGLYQTGEFGTTHDGKFGLISGKSFGTLSNGAYYEAMVQNGNVVRITTLLQDKARLDIQTKDSTQGIRFDSDGRVVEGQITLDNRASLVISNAVVDGIRITQNAPPRDPVGYAAYFATLMYAALNQDSQSQEREGESSIVDVIKDETTTVFIFGNGFENKVRAENTPDPLMQSFVDHIEKKDLFIAAAKEIVVYLYELTDMVTNAYDWLQDFNVLLGAFVSPAATAVDKAVEGILSQDFSSPDIPQSIKPALLKAQAWFKSFSEFTGLGNNLVKEVIEEMEELQDDKGRIKDGIAFAHSGFTAPVLAAIEQKKYDVETVLIYEGPHPTYKTQFTNPNLKRIIHVMGSSHGLLDSLLEGDSPVPFLGWAHFDNSAHNLENINIEIQGAFHSDYAYNPKSYEFGGEFYGKTAERQAINRKVNLFMRDLYQAAYKDQVDPSLKLLEIFFAELESRGTAKKANGLWKIDPSKLRDEAS